MLRLLLNKHSKIKKKIIIGRFTGIGFVHTKRDQFFFFPGVLTTPISRSPREGVDTCRDRALNASGRGYYDQAKAGRAVKATHGT